MGIKFSEAKRVLESQKVFIGIGYFVQDDVKKKKSFMVDFKKKPEDFDSAKEYEAALEKHNEKCEENFNAYFELENKKAEIIIRMPTLDEVMSVAKTGKKLPDDLEGKLDMGNKDILETVLGYLEVDTDSKEVLDNGLRLIKDCYLDSTFEKEDKPTITELMDLIKKSQGMSQHVVEEFFKLSINVGK